MESLESVQKSGAKFVSVGPDYGNEKREQLGWEFSLESRDRARPHLLLKVMYSN